MNIFFFQKVEPFSIYVPRKNKEVCSCCAVLLLNYNFFCLYLHSNKNFKGISRRCLQWRSSWRASYKEKKKLICERVIFVQLRI